jgi:hypothetical protein
MEQVTSRKKTALDLDHYALFNPEKAKEEKLKKQAKEKGEKYIPPPKPEPKVSKFRDKESMLSHVNIVVEAKFGPKIEAMIKSMKKTNMVKIGHKGQNYWHFHSRLMGKQEGILNEALRGIKHTKYEVFN